MRRIKGQEPICLRAMVVEGGWASKKGRGRYIYCSPYVEKEIDFRQHEVKT